MKNMTQKNPVLAGLLLAVILFVADRISKQWAVDLLSQSGSRIEVAPFFDLVLVWNPGISYGLLDQGGAGARLALTAITGALVVFCLVWMVRSHSVAMALCLGAIVGGGAGNFIDRILWGAVADFISLHAGGFYWYVFNLADAAIVLGALGLFWFWHHPDDAH